MRARGELVVGTTDRMLRAAGVRLRPRLTAVEGSAVRFADGAQVKVALVWATDYRPDYSWIDVDGLLVDGRGAGARPRRRPRPGSTSWGWPGSTAAGRPCSGSSATTPPTWPTRSPRTPQRRKPGGTTGAPPRLPPATSNRPSRPDKIRRLR